MRFLHGDVEWRVDWFLNVHEREREREISNHKFQPSVHHKQEVPSSLFTGSGLFSTSTTIMRYRLW